MRAELVLPWPKVNPTLKPWIKEGPETQAHVWAYMSASIQATIHWDLVSVARLLVAFLDKLI